MKDEIVQLRNPRTNRWVKVNKTLGLIYNAKKTPGPYKNITIINNDDRNSNHNT